MPVAIQALARVLLVLVLSGHGVLFAEPLEPAAARALVQEFLDATRSYQARFRQTLSDEAGVVIEEGEGEVWLERPGRLHWRYEEPWPRLIVARDGDIWLYDEELEQVTVRKLGQELAQTPAALLIGDSGQLDQYAVRGERYGDVATIELAPPDGQGDFRRVSLVLRNQQLLELGLYDNFGQLTRIEFGSVRSNVPVDPQLFEFTLPAGADLIDERGGN